MTKQELFTKASREYQKSCNLITSLCDELNKKHDKLIGEFDVIIQISLLYLASFDEKVTSTELDFIDKIAVDRDIIEIYNEKTGLKLTWEDCLNIRTNQIDYLKLIDNIYLSFSNDIYDFIITVCAYDSNTDDDYLNSFKGYILEIGLYFLSIDSNSCERKKCFEFLNNKLFKNMDVIKNTFLLAQKINI